MRSSCSGAAPLLVLSGGGTGPVPEAEIMRRMARARGVREAALLVEAGSRDTLENAWETARLLRPRGARGFSGQRSRPFAASGAVVPSRRPAHLGLRRGAAAFAALGGLHRNPRVRGAAEKPGAGFSSAGSL